MKHRSSRLASHCHLGLSALLQHPISVLVASISQDSLTMGPCRDGMVLEARLDHGVARSDALPSESAGK